MRYVKSILQTRLERQRRLKVGQGSSLFALARPHTSCSGAKEQAE